MAEIIFEQIFVLGMEKKYRIYVNYSKGQRLRFISTSVATEAHSLNIQRMFHFVTEASSGQSNSIWLYERWSVKEDLQLWRTDEADKLYLSFRPYRFFIVHQLISISLRCYVTHKTVLARMLQIRKCIGMCRCVHISMLLVLPGYLESNLKQTGYISYVQSTSHEGRTKRRLSVIFF